MKVVGLVSGGKDSIFNMLQCVAAGHEITAIANIEPEATTGEMDSYMYQTVGQETVGLLKFALSVPLYRLKTRGVAVCQDKLYTVSPNDEVEDLYNLLLKVKEETHVEAVAVGAIASDYQRTRVENVCQRLNLKSVAYLWARDQLELLQEMIDASVHAIVVKVACLGLTPDKHLGMTIQDLQPQVELLHNKFSVNVCGEGGEYETFVLDCPLYHKSIEILESEKKIHSQDDLAPVAYLHMSKSTLSLKLWGNISPVESLKTRIEDTQRLVHDPMYYIQDCMSLQYDEDTTMTPGNETPTTLVRTPVLHERQVAGRESRVVDLARRDRDMMEVSRSSSLLMTKRSSMVQMHHSSGWCFIGSLSGPNIYHVLTTLKADLERHQYTLADIVSVNLYLADMADFARVNKTYLSFIQGPNPPVRVCATACLGESSVLMSVVAHRNVSKASKVMKLALLERHVVHVQSISHWAPANIGPYSQSCMIGDIVYMAGQIPLVPGSMDLLAGTLGQQMQLVSRHVTRLLNVHGLDASHVVHVTIFTVQISVAVKVEEMWRSVTGNKHATVGVVVARELPRGAAIELHPLAVSHAPDNDTTEVDLGDNFVLKAMRCCSRKTTTASLVSLLQSTAGHGTGKVPVHVLVTAVERSVSFLRPEPSLTNPCYLHLYYASSEHISTQQVTEALGCVKDTKVVMTAVPVVACVTPHTLVMITAISH